MPLSDRTGVQLCEKGFYSISGLTECVECAEGFFSEELGAMGCSACTACDLGKRMKRECTAIADATCEDCEAGTFGNGTSACFMCASGTYRSKAGQLYCATVVAGFYSNEQRTEVEKCPMNTFSIGATNLCEACPPGGHSVSGNSSCEYCTTGLYHDAVSNTCLKCPSGTASISGAANITGCLSCETGLSYQPNEGQGVCLPCSTCGLGTEIARECDEVSDTVCASCLPSFASLGGDMACEK